MAASLLRPRAAGLVLTLLWCVATPGACALDTSGQPRIVAQVQTFLDPAWPSAATHGKTGSPTIAFATSFGSHMVLQREPYVATIWGTATDMPTSTVVKVDLFTTSGRKTPVLSINATVNDTSKEWVATFPCPMVGSTTVTYFITASVRSFPASTIQLEDVLFGDVYVASGQSNMAFLLKNAFNGSVLVQDANNYPNIRLFTSKKIASTVPLSQQPEVEEKWSVGSNYSVLMHSNTEDDNWLYMSAVAWLFARTVHRAVGIPIGILNTNWGGTPIEFWMSADALNACPHPPPSSVGDSQAPTQGWNGMIVPLLRTSVRGVIWYQGENNAGQKNGAELYKCRFPAMIADWRLKFASFKYFGFVQLSSYVANNDVAGIRWSQTAGFGYVPNEKMPNTYMSLAIDLGDKTSPYGSVHSRHKQELGKRLGDQALQKIYGVKPQYSRPLLQAIKQDGSGAFIMSFRQASVVIRNASVGWEICNAAGACCVPGSVASVNSTAVRLKANTSPPTGKGTMIRYLWSSFACNLLACSLYGPGDRSEALPVGPFQFLVSDRT